MHLAGVIILVISCSVSESSLDSVAVVLLSITSGVGVVFIIKYSSWM